MQLYVLFSAGTTPEKDYVTTLIDEYIVAGAYPSLKLFLVFIFIKIISNKEKHIYNTNSYKIFYKKFLTEEKSMDLSFFIYQ